MAVSSVVPDVFLSYSRPDQAAVLRLGRGLRERGLVPFLDQWALVQGHAWPEALEYHLNRCRAVAVCLGPGEMGPWQKREMYVALDRQVREPNFPVLAVLLPGANDPGLGFLRLNTWVDLRGRLDDEAAVDALAASVRGDVRPDGSAPALDPRADICPYRGLNPFREEDADFFFGRGEAVAELLAKVRAKDLIAVVGASGSGKSSVVRTGLVPALRRGADGRVWEVATLAPGERPLHSFAAVLLPLLPPEGGQSDVIEDPVRRRALINERAGLLASGRVSVRDLVEDLLARQPGTERLLVVLDQFEEFYTVKDAAEPGRLLLDGLLEASERLPLSLVLTLRGDFYGRVISDRSLSDRLRDAVVNVSAMRPEERREVIVRPSECVGLGFEPGLVDAILTEVGEEPGNLPLLEFLLTELWRQRHRGLLTHDAYAAMGGLKRAIAERAERTLAGMAEADLGAARRLLVQLVRPGEGEADTRARRVLPDGLGPEAAVIDRLVRARLLVAGRDPATGRETVEVAHEALIRNWERLAGWVDEDREFLRTCERVRAQMRHWQEAGEPDDLLLARGRALEEGRELLLQRDHPFIQDIVPYVERSVTHEERQREAERREHRRRLRRARVAGLTMAALAAVGIWLWLQARHNADQAMRNEERAHQSAEQARQSAEQAHQNLDHALNAAGAVIKGMTDPSQNLIAIEVNAAKLILNNTDEIISRLETTLGSSVSATQEARLQSAKAWMQVLNSDLYRRMGHSRQALDHATEAARSLESLADRDPGDVELRDQLGESYNRIATLLHARGDLARALEYARRAIAVLEPLHEHEPDDPRWNFDLATNHGVLAGLLRSMGNDAGANAEGRKETTYMRRAEVMAPNNPHWRAVFASNKLSFGTWFLQQGGNPLVALDSFRTGLALLEADIGESISRAQAIAVSAELHQQIASALHEHRKPEEALEHLNKAIALRRRSIEMDPDDITRKFSLMITLRNVAEVLMAQGNFSEAGALLRESLDLSEKLVAFDPENTYWQVHFASVHAAIGSMAESQGEPKAALDSYRKAHAIPRPEVDRQGRFEDFGTAPSCGAPRRFRAVRSGASSSGVRSGQQRYTLRIHVKANARRAAW
jgi:tetratricopeptide (TPR) repeat protein